MSRKRDTLIIGGAGYIGKRLVPVVSATGRRVTVLDQRSLAPSVMVEDVDYVLGDYGKLDQICSLLDRHQEIIHLAYATVPNTSFDNPLADSLQNLPPTVQLFSEIASRGRKLLFVSSGGTVYGQSNTNPICEGHSTKPISPYGVTKLMLEHYAHLYSVTRGLQYICVRPANAFGVGQRPFVGQGFISTAMASVMRGKPIEIFGENGAVRDYIYVSDIAKGIVSALEKGDLFETYNLGSGVGRSNADVVETIRHLVEENGHRISINYFPARVFDVEVNVLDSTKIKEHTGWKPQVCFEDGLKFTYEWLRENYT